MLNHLDNQASFMTTLFIFTSRDKSQALFLYQFINRSSKTMPKNLTALKANFTLPFCENFLAFGFCPFHSNLCISRHNCKQSEGPHQGLMIDGQIKFIFSYIVSANQ